MSYDFPASPTNGDEYTPPVGGQTYIFQSPRWLVKGVPPAGGGGGGGIDEAPVDARQYGRQDAAWTEVVANPTWSTLSGKPATFPPTVPIPWTDVSGKPATFPPTVPIAYTDISGKPATFPPTLPIAQADVTNLVTDLAAKQASDTTLTALAGLNAATGLVVQSAADTFLKRSLAGVSARTTITNADGAAGNPTVDIAATYVGQSSITTLGTIATGTWNGTDVAVTAGGTGASDAATARTNLGLIIGTDVAPVAAPVFTGDARAVTPATADNDTSIATTAYVKANMALVPAATAQARNRIVNGAMQISQENGDTSSTNFNFFPADQWYVTYTTSGTITSQRVQSTTPNGSRYRLRHTITVADAALAAGDYLELVHKIEGSRAADFMWGTASARQVVLRFGWKSPAGTYSICIMNSAATRCYTANFTVSAGQANTDTEYTLVIPGDTTGTWTTDTTLGLRVDFVLAAGTTYQGSVGWKAGSYLLGTASNTNGMATAGAVFELYDVGLYLDPLNTGVAPPWVMPDEAEELLACLRYFQKFRGILTVASLAYTGSFLTPMRILPACSYVADAGTGAVVAASDRFGFYQQPVHSLASGAMFTFNARM